MDSLRIKYWIFQLYVQNAMHTFTYCNIYILALCGNISILSWCINYKVIRLNGFWINNRLYTEYRITLWLLLISHIFAGANIYYSPSWIWGTLDKIPKYITRRKYEYIAPIFRGMEHVCSAGRGVMVCVYAVKRQIT